MRSEKYWLTWCVFCLLWGE